MTIKSKSFIILFLLSLALPLRAWRVFPLLSYSSSSGVLVGGIVNHNMISPFSPFGFSSMVYGYTDGSIFAEPQLLFKAGSAAEGAQLNGDKTKLLESLTRLKTYFVINGVLALIGVIIGAVSVIMTGGALFSIMDQF